MPASLYRPSALVCLTASLMACSAGAREKRPEPAFARDMLEAHNQARATARPAPKPALPALQWSAEAAKLAESYAAKCTFEHNPKRGGFGENLAAATPGSWKTADVVKDWNSEAAHYNLGKNTCAPGKVCGHYTQLVWRNTTHVGCAVRTCTKNSPFGKNFPTWEYWVCNYAPPGNFVGQRPY